MNSAIMHDAHFFQQSDSVRNLYNAIAKGKDGELALQHGVLIIDAFHRLKLCSWFSASSSKGKHKLQTAPATLNRVASNKLFVHAFRQTSPFSIDKQGKILMLNKKLCYKFIILFVKCITLLSQNISCGSSRSSAFHSPLSLFSNPYERTVNDAL